MIKGAQRLREINAEKDKGQGWSLSPNNFPLSLEHYKYCTPERKR